MALRIVALVIALFVASGGASAATPAPEDPMLSAAANAAMRGESSRAGAMLDPLPDSPHKSLILACIALNEGRAQEALDRANRLLETNPLALEVQLLRTLATARIKNPNEPWVDATVREMRTVRWVDEESTLIAYQPITTVVPIDESRLAGLSGLDGFLVRAAEHWKTDKSKVLAEARQWIKPDSPRVALLVAFAAFGNDGTTRPLRSASARSEALQYLLAQNPESAFLRFGSVMEGPPGKPFTDGDLDNLNHALEGKDSWLPFREMYEAFENAYAHVDPAQAAEAASSAVFDFYPTWSLGLPAQRAEATEVVATEGTREKLGRVFEKLGDLYRNAETVLDRTVAGTSWARASRLASNEALKKQTREFRQRLKEEMDAPIEPMLVLCRLPLRSAVEPILEMKMKDEVGLYERLRP